MTCKSKDRQESDARVGHVVVDSLEERRKPTTPSIIGVERGAFGRSTPLAVGKRVQLPFALAHAGRVFGLRWE
jgi:hypothetical protein